MDQTHRHLAELLGGAGAVRAVVDDLYERILGDPALSGYFRDVDLTAQRSHMTAALVSVLNAPTGRARAALSDRLTLAHAGRHITNDAFDQTAGHLLDALAASQVAPDLVDEVILQIAALRPQVVDPHI